MLMPSIFGENLFDDFFTLERPQKQYEKEAISTCRDAKRRISRQN